MPIKDLAGQRFGRLLILRQEASDGNGNARWRYRCDCGTERITLGCILRSGQSQSCGCLDAELKSKRSRKHGRAGSRLIARDAIYTIWADMKDRCSNPNNRKYHLYGGRGIVVCERWHSSFENFLADMGERPSPRHTIDRYPDRNGNYETTNCRWATYSQQNNNKNNQRWVEYCGKQMTLTEAVMLVGINRNTVYTRLNCGWTLERALETPVRR